MNVHLPNLSYYQMWVQREVIFIWCVGQLHTKTEECINIDSQSLSAGSGGSIQAVQQSNGNKPNKCQ